MQSPERRFKKLKEAGVFLAWIAGMFLIAGLAWFFSRPLRTGLMIRNINTVLRNSPDSRQLEGRLYDSQRGTWYSVHNSEDRAVVISIMADGILVPYLLFVSPQGGMTPPIPLGSHSARMQERLPREVFQTVLREKK
ncbi:hypothetical protein AGMMS49944_19270 [Spirochaetia bacterium]|nr:hypothetical protein AGMMS49944_19270 [Spirochaetia bacterium]